jgi:hypothetical protein
MFQLLQGITGNTQQATATVLVPSKPSLSAPPSTGEKLTGMNRKFFEFIPKINLRSFWQFCSNFQTDTHVI